MKYIHAFIPALIISYNVAASEGQKTLDPFAEAHDHYNQSNWAQASECYKKTLLNIRKGMINKQKIEPLELVKAHVNYADVTYALAIDIYNQGNKEKAQQLMLEACNHWTHRLKGGQFGRTPLNNEWNGSNLNGKKLVVYSERDSGAFGDTFFMSAMLRYAKEKGAYVIFVPQKPLAKLYDKTYLPYSLQAQYVDEVAIRGEVPEHDKAIYLWSILKHYLNEKTADTMFPLQPCLSGQVFLNSSVNRKINDMTQHYGVVPFLVGIWWRSAGPAAMAADWRKLDRDPGAHRMLSTIQDLPVLVFNLEGLGRVPLSEEELKQRQEKNTAGNSDMVDITTYSTDNIFNFGQDFDREIPFADTLAIMEFIKNQGGVLIGCDTGLCNAAAMIKKNTEKNPLPSVLAILNKRADFRWGADTTSPRPWHHSKDVLIFQAQEQGQWEEPLAQAREIIKNRIAIQALKQSQ